VEEALGFTSLALQKRDVICIQNDRRLAGPLALRFSDLPAQANDFVERSIVFELAKDLPYHGVSCSLSIRSSSSRSSFSSSRTRFSSSLTLLDIAFCTLSR
jgi:hypothetical protein